MRVKKPTGLNDIHGREAPALRHCLRGIISGEVVVFFVAIHNGPQRGHYQQTHILESLSSLWLPQNAECVLAYITDGFYHQPVET